MRSGESQREIAKRIVDPMQKTVGELTRDIETKAVAISGDILDGNVTARAGDRKRDRPSGCDERLNRIGEFRCRDTFSNFIACQIADGQQQVVQAVQMSHVILRIKPLQLTLERQHRLQIEKFPEFRVADQLTK